MSNVYPLSALNNLLYLNLLRNPISDFKFIKNLTTNLTNFNQIELPAKYRVPIEKWSSQWLLKEPNAELRRLLIQVIGYEKICAELGAIELDKWREYSLLKIAFNVLDEEDIYLLKMTCPSTGYIHVLRVPPEVNSCREAVQWINWGIDPEDFAIQT